jgi:hypothetical protein
MSRDIALLTPRLRTLYTLHMAALFDAGVKAFCTYTLRTPAEQEALYAQGRKPLMAVNALRVAAGMNPITDQQNARPITWTMLSEHLPGTDGLSRAYDLGILGPRGAVWDPKYDGNANGLPDWEDMARIAETLSLPTGERLKPGIRFPAPATDPPHYQLAYNYGPS